MPKIKIRLTLEYKNIIDNIFHQFHQQKAFELTFIVLDLKRRGAFYISQNPKPLDCVINVPDPSIIHPLNGLEKNIVFDFHDLTRELSEGGCLVQTLVSLDDDYNALKRQLLLDKDPSSDITIEDTPLSSLVKSATAKFKTDLLMEDKQLEQDQNVAYKNDIFDYFN